MKIEPKLLTKWQKLRSPEDTQSLSERIENGYPELFARAFRMGTCSDRVFQAMAKFYDEKAEMIKQYL